MRGPGAGRFGAVFALLLAISFCATGSQAAEGPNLGTPIAPDDLAPWQKNVFPDGRGLPQGRGTAREGKPIFDVQCAGCHGPKGRGHTAEELAGSTKSLTDPEPDKTIGTYWPFATTIFDFVRRSMPMHAPGSLSDAEVYAVTAYLLFENGLVAEDAVIDATSLPKVVMPNRNGFDRIDAK